jgi:formate transporter
VKLPGEAFIDVRTDQDGGRFPGLTWANFVVGNLLPVTIGNMIGGSMVAAVDWLVYLRKQ